MSSTPGGREETGHEKFIKTAREELRYLVIALDQWVEVPADTRRAGGR